MTFTLPYLHTTDFVQYQERVRHAVSEELRVSEPEAVEDLAGRRLKAEVVFHPPSGRHDLPLHALVSLVTDAVSDAAGFSGDHVDHLVVSRGARSKNGGSVTYTIEPDTRTPF